MGAAILKLTAIGLNRPTDKLLHFAFPKRPTDKLRYANAATRFLCVPGKRGTRFTKPNYVFLPFVTGCSSGRIRSVTRQTP